MKIFRLLFCLLLALAGPAQAVAPLLLSDATPAVDAWPALTVLADPTLEMTLADVQKREREFAPPQGPQANFGRSRDALWLRLPVLAAPGQRQWVMELDYAPLNRIDVYLLRDGRLQSQHRLGNDQPFGARPVASRAHALRLELAPGEPHVLLMRVQSTSSMLVPIAFYTPDHFLAHESTQQLLQGLCTGISLALLLYSLAQWLILREALFGLYAVVVGGVTLFFLSYTGVGQQYLWHETSGLLGKIAPLAVLVALAGGSLFFRNSLRLDELRPRLSIALCVVAAIALLALGLSLLGVLDYRMTQTAATLLGPVPMLLAVPVAFRQARAGDRASLFMLLGWGAYLVGAITIAGLLRGLLPVNGWSQHVFQIASVLEMAVWVNVLGLRIEGIRSAAERTELERLALHSLAHTDVLTGVPNRRGLQVALAQALPRSQPGQALALFMLDLDGFKAVNDHLGHDAGDELLKRVADRLQHQVRTSDLVARLGGDEFVIMAAGLGDEAAAQRLGHKLLQAFDSPFEVTGRHCRVGLTIGYVLAPDDGRDATELLKRADSAMYAGKQAGRHCLRRAAPVLAG